MSLRLILFARLSTDAQHSFSLHTLQDDNDDLQHNLVKMTRCRRCSRNREHLNGFFSPLRTQQRGKQMHRPVAKSIVTEYAPLEFGMALPAVQVSETHHAGCSQFCHRVICKYSIKCAIDVSEMNCCFVTSAYCKFFVCPSVRLSVRPFVVVLFVLLFLAGFWVLQSVGPCVWSGWRCAVSPGPPLQGSLGVG